MMNSTLETKQEISLLEAGPQREEWMDAVPEEEFTEDQKIVCHALLSVKHATRYAYACFFMGFAHTISAH